MQNPRKKAKLHFGQYFSKRHLQPKGMKSKELKTRVGVNFRVKDGNKDTLYVYLDLDFVIFIVF